MIFIKNLIKELFRNLPENWNSNYYHLCRGYGLEVGAFDNPCKFHSHTYVDYVDIGNSQELYDLYNKISKGKRKLKKIVNPNYILKEPKYKFSEINSNKYDFIYSSHVIEHSKNPLQLIAEMIRVTKINGIIYMILPNKNYTYDKKRDLSNINYLIKKYHQKIFSFSKREALEIITKTIGFKKKYNFNSYSLNKIIDIILNDKGLLFHYYVYNDELTIDMIHFLKKKFKIKIKYYASNKNGNIHIALQK